MVKDAWPVTKDSPSIITNVELAKPQDVLIVREAIPLKDVTSLCQDTPESAVKVDFNSSNVLRLLK